MELMTSVRNDERSGGEALDEMERAVRLASDGEGWRVANFATHEGEPGMWRARGEDPLEALLARVERGKRAAQFAPPLMGIVSDLDAATELYGHPHLLDDEEELYDVFDVLSPAPSRSMESVREVASPPATKNMVAPPSPPTPPLSPPKKGSSGGMIADVMLDAIATRALPGEARAEAARLLSQGLVLGDEVLMQEALAVLLTGQT